MEKRPTCKDICAYGNLPKAGWPWYIKVALLFRPAIVVMDDDGAFGYKFKTMFGNTYIVDQISNYVTPERFRTKHAIA